MRGGARPRDLYRRSRRAAGGKREFDQALGIEALGRKSRLVAEADFQRGRDAVVQAQRHPFVREQRAGRRGALAQIDLLMPRIGRDSGVALAEFETEARQRKALANYQRVVLNAFRETDDVLTGTEKKRQEAAVRTQTEAYTQIVNVYGWGDGW